jgi:hypothetical protein
MGHPGYDCRARIKEPLSEGYAKGELAGTVSGRSGQIFFFLEKGNTVWNG